MTTKPGSWTLLIHVEDEYDYKIWTERRIELVQILQIQYKTLTNKELRVNKVYKKISKY